MSVDVTRAIWTVLELSEHRGLRQEVILGWIRGGELRAVNEAANPKGRRPRWRIRDEDLQAFLRQRSTGTVAATSTPTPRRRPRPKEATEHF